MTRKQKKNLIRIIISLSLFVIIFIFDKIFNLATLFSTRYGWFFPFGLYLIVYIIIGYDVIFKAFRNIGHGQFLDENFLMVIATFGAFGLAIYRGVEISRGIEGVEIEGFDEACAVLLFYQVGEFFQDYAVGKSRKEISSLMDIRPDYANLLKDGKFEVVDPDEVNVGDTILVKPGEKIPLDGVVISGNSTLDTKALTGESKPRSVTCDDDVISGCINMTGEIRVKVSKAFYDSTVNKILELVENASEQKSKTEKFISKFARYYTPIVVGAALCLAIIPSLITSDWATWIYRSLSFLVVSCPCALVISIPLTFFAGIGCASKHGVLVKGSNYLEKFSKVKTFVFDKTGTLTKGNFSVIKINNVVSEQELLTSAYVAEKNSSHPIATSLKNYYLAHFDDVDSHYELENVAGRGIIAHCDEEDIYCGNDKLMVDHQISYIPCNEVGSIIYVAKGNNFLGSIVIGDQIKDEAKDLIAYLNKVNINTIMLTGDNEQVAQSVAQELNLSSYRANLLPQDKVSEIEKIMANKAKNDVVCFVGDGINDAPVLMRSDIGIAMGGIGSDAAIEASDIVLMDDDLKGIAIAKKITNKTMIIVKENIYVAIGIKIIILILSSLGITNMWVAIFGDVGVALLAILNALRVNRKY